MSVNPVHLLFGYAAVAAIAASPARAQAKPDSSAPAALDVSGKWRLTTPVGGAALVLSVVQTGTRLEAQIAQHVQCAGRDVKVQVDLAGYVEGRVVRLRSTGGRLEGDVGDICTQYSEVTGQVDFVGELSADGKKIVGPYDHSRQPTHTWTLSR